MKIDILTLFPEMFESPFNYSMVKRAIEGGQVEINPINFREYGVGKHQMVDDTPYGGGAGMLLKPEPIFEAIMTSLRGAQGLSFTTTGKRIE
mgnify:CR=1 FL=1